MTQRTLRAIWVLIGFLCIALLATSLGKRSTPEAFSPTIRRFYYAHYAVQQGMTTAGTVPRMVELLQETADTAGLVDLDELNAIHGDWGARFQAHVQGGLQLAIEGFQGGDNAAVAAGMERLDAWQAWWNSHRGEVEEAIVAYYSSASRR